MRLFLLLFPVFALAATDWQALLNANHGERVHFGVVLGGTDPYQASENEDFAPASTAKLFTAGLALATLSPDYRYPTLLRWTESTAGTASNVTLVGSGDPSWGLSELHEGLRDRLDAYAAALRAAGIETVRGDLRAVAADPRWNNVTIPEGWKEADSTSCGGSLAQGFNLDLNCATLTITSASSATWKSEGLELPVALAIDAGPSTSLSVKLVPNGQSFAYRVSGTFKAGGGPHSYTLPIYDTRSWAANLLRSALAAKGIKFEPAAGDEDAGTPKQLVFYSAPLGELIKPFLKNSVNFMGDAFLKTVGAQSGFEESDSSLLAPGLSRLYAFLGGGRDFTLHDGSGLSRTSRITPAFLLAYLERVKNESYFPALYAALPVAGVDGTLAHRMKGTAAAGVLHAKTGTLDGVYNLAGYVPQGKNFVPFVILTATTGSSSEIARSAEDRVGAKLAEVNHEEGTAVEQVDPYPYVPGHAGTDDQ